MKEAVTRLIIAVIFMFNAILTAKGRNPLPIDENAVAGFISQIFAAASLVYVWWKNNNVTHESRVAQEYLNELKAERKNAGGTNDINTEEAHAALDPDKEA